VTQSQQNRIPVYVVLPPRMLMLDIAGPAEVLRRTNLEQNRVRFDVYYCGPSTSILTSIGLTVSAIAPLPISLPEGAIVILAGDVDSVMLPNRCETSMCGDEADKALLVQWLKTTIRPDHLLVCICSGALFAAEAGLLAGHDCTTHHTCCEELARLASDARVVENRLYVEDRNRLTSAGITAGIDLTLHLVSRLVDPLCAMKVARHLVVYLRRSGNDPQLSPWLTGRNHLHRAVHRVQDAIAAAPANPWTLDALAEIAGASSRHLSRLFNEHVGMNIPDFINHLRVVLAHEYLSQTQLDMENVAERVGFASTRQLRRTWRRYYPMPPSHVRSHRSERATLQ